MVYCEVCGERPAEVKARIENSVLKVCNQCAPAGNVIASIQAPIAPRIQQSMVIEGPEEILIEGYGRKIGAARSAAGMTQEEFAAKLNVNSAVLKAAEAGRRLDIQTAKRIERALKIRLIENI